MNIFKFYKQTLAILLVSFLFVGCSNKSKSTYGDGTNNPTNQDGNGTNNDGNGTNNSDGIAGADQNVSIGDSFTLNGTTTLNGTPAYQWSENDTNLSNEESFEGTTGTGNNVQFVKGEHIFTLTVTNDKGDTESDTVSIKVGEYITTKETYTDCNGKVTVKEYAYDEKGNLTSIKESVNGDPYATITYEYNPDGTLKSKTSKTGDQEAVTTEFTTPSTTDTRDATGSGDIVTVDIYGVIRTFSYVNGKLVSGKAVYKDGKEKIYSYETDDDGRIISETVTDSSGTETINYSYDESGNRIQEGSDTIGDTCEVTVTKEETFIW